MNALFQSEFCGRLCLALGHSLWQAGAVAVVASAIAFALRRRSANVRYNVYLGGMLVALAAFPVTFAVLQTPQTSVAASTRDVAIDAALQLPSPVATAVPHSLSPTIEQLAVTPAPSLAPHSSLLASAPLPRFAPWIAAAYLIGVLAMAMRLALGMWSAGALSRRAAVAGGDLALRLEHIARLWKLRVVPRLAVSAEVMVPKVVGILRPVILLPLSATTGLAPDQLDMILAHELAHVRRHDLWVNLLQRLAETLLFFNPAIWYLSRRLTTLREFACDELVCTGHDGNAASTARYAAALVRVAELSRPRAAEQIAAIAATGKGPSELRRRVARLVGEPLREPVRLSRTGLFTLAILGVLLAATPALWPTGSVSAEQRGEPAQSQTYNDTIAQLTLHAKAVYENPPKREINVWGASEAAWPIIGQLSELDGLTITASDLRKDEFNKIDKLTNLKRLTIINCKFLPAQLAPLAALTNLEHLDVLFSITEESDEWRAEQLGELSAAEQAEFERLIALPRSNERTIRTAIITDRSIPALRGLSNLKTLRLANTFLTGDGLKQLGTLENLEEVEIGVLGISPDAAKVFRNMPKLRTLRYFNVSDAVVAELATLENLQELDIWCAGVTDAGAAELAKLTKLKRLEIRGNQITDGGLSKIAALPNLKRLDLRHSKAITPLGVDEFGRKNPACTVVYLPESKEAIEIDRELTRLRKLERTNERLAVQMARTQMQIKVLEEMSKQPTLTKKVWDKLDSGHRREIEAQRQEYKRQIRTLEAERDLLADVHKDLEQQLKIAREQGKLDASLPPETQTDPDPLDEQIDAALKADPKAAMLMQEIMTREYWIMQLRTTSENQDSPQIKAYEKEKAAMEQQLTEYREKISQQFKKQYPFSVHGRVTDGDGKPMEGITIRAATGIGTLKSGGETTTGADGRYRLPFRAGMMLLEDYAPLNVGLQAAIITAHKSGWYETNLSRQGDLQMSDQKPDDLMEDGWGLESTESVVFPHQPREVNFTLGPAVVIEGVLVGDGTWEIENQSLSLTGDELPPASSVLRSVTTNKDGKFQMDGVPPGKPWRFEMRIKGTGGEVVSEPFTVPEPGVYRCRVSLDTQAGDDGSVVLTLRQERMETP